MLKKRRSKKLVAEINVVPYIDVMLVLLVIFIVTAPLLQQGVAVDLPSASAKALPAAEKEPIIVSVDVKGNYYLNISDSPQLPIEKDPLSLRVSAELKRSPQRKVLVKADKSVNYGKVVGAMVILQQSGAPSVGLVTQDDSKINHAPKSSNV
ncbi:MAG: protein TolR [Proteobacteria bacterium]|nr:protein TolR [Pseudomonadota bacterium]